MIMVRCFLAELVSIGGPASSAVVMSGVYEQSLCGYWFQTASGLVGDFSGSLVIVGRDSTARL